MRYKSIFLVIGVFFSIFLLLSSTTAAPIINNQHIEKNQEINKNIEKNNKSKQKILGNIWNKTREILLFLNLSVHIMFNIIRWPFQGLKNIITYAFIENSFIRSVVTEVNDLSLNETIKVAIVIMLWPLIGLKNIITYAFIENHFIRTLLDDIFELRDFSTLKNVVT
jgi:hypothetical protein